MTKLAWEWERVLGHLIMVLGIGKLICPIPSMLREWKIILKSDHNQARYGNGYTKHGAERGNLSGLYQTLNKLVKMYGNGNPIWPVPSASARISHHVLD